MIMENDIVVINAHHGIGPLDEWEVWIDRKHSALGNPYSHLKKNTLAEFQVDTRDEAIDKYKEWIEEQLKDESVNIRVKREFMRLRSIFKRFGKLTMICWCVPNRCHGEILRDLIVKDNPVLLI